MAAERPPHPRTQFRRQSGILNGVWDFATLSERALLRRVIRRETVRLVALTLVALAAFFITRALAHRAHALAEADAAEWYRRGQEELRQGEPQRAATAFRRATMKQRGERLYALGLAEALARSGNDDAARRALLDLREFSPEDAEVNLALARLARQRGDVEEAVRYYRHAVYAPGSDADAARIVRFELIRMLLDASDQRRAASEIIAATVDLPDDPELRLRIGDLFQQAGEPARALEQYERILAGDRGHSGALAGAVQAAFALGNYRQVAAYRLPDTSTDEARQLVDVSRAVLTRDPLAARLSSAERRRRLQGLITHLQQRLKTCAVDTRSLADAMDEKELTALRTLTRRGSFGRDSEQLESAFSRLLRTGQRIDQRCQGTTEVDRALAIIARQHGILES